MNVQNEDLMFKHPFTALISGPTGSGKTVFFTKLLENVKQMISPTPTRIVYCYSLWQQQFNDMLLMVPNIEFKQGLVTMDEFNPQQINLIVRIINLSNIFSKKMKSYA